MPQTSQEDEFIAAFPHRVVEQLGAVVFESEVWERLRSEVPSIPAVTDLPVSNARALIDAWALGNNRPKQLTELPKMLRAKLVACDTLENSEAIALVQHWASRVDAPKLACARLGAGARIEKLYFDGPQSEDWAAFAVVDGEYLPVIGERIYYSE